MAITLGIILGMKHVSDKRFGENQNKILCSITPPSTPPENRAVYEMMWKNLI